MYEFVLLVLLNVLIVLVVLLWQNYFKMHLAQLEKQVTEKTWLEVLWPFGCKISSYSSFEEVRSVLIWRAQSCFVDSIADEVNRRVFVPGLIRNGRTTAQLEWLSRRNPLRGHAAWGTVMVRRQVLCNGHHPETQQAVSRLCNTITALPDSLLHVASRNLLDSNLFDYTLTAHHQLSAGVCGGSQP